MWCYISFALLILTNSSCVGYNDVKLEINTMMHTMVNTIRNKPDLVA